MDKNYETVLIADDKGRITIPVQVREKMGSSSKMVYRLIYDVVSNVITLMPIGVDNTNN